MNIYLYYSLSFWSLIGSIVFFVQGVDIWRISNLKQKIFLSFVFGPFVCLLGAFYYTGKSFVDLGKLIYDLLK